MCKILVIIFSLINSQDYSSIKQTMLDWKRTYHLSI